VTDDPDPRVQRILEPPSKAPSIFVLAAIVILCLCFSYRSELYTGFFASPAVDAAPAVTAEDFDSVKRQMAESSQAMLDELNRQRDGTRAQKADIQKLTDQVSSLASQISVLNGKIDALQKVQAASASHAQMRPEAFQSAVPKRPHSVAVRKRPVVAKPDNPAPDPATSPAFPILVPQTVPSASGN
jgi:TolA-binding protein